MAVKIRLQRHGKKNFAFFHIVVADSRSPRDGRYIEQLGTYNPNTNPATIVLNQAEADKKWNDWKAQRDAKIEAKKTAIKNSAVEARKAAKEAEVKVNEARAEALAKKAAELAAKQQEAEAEASADEAAAEAPAAEEAQAEA